MPGDLRLVMVVAAQGATEIAQPASERAADLGKALRSEHEQRHHEYKQQVGGLKNVSDHLAEHSP